jgi:hypothetical protein
MPNPDRNLFFEHQGLPTHKRWQDGYSELSLKVYRAFDRVVQLAQRYPDPVTVSHRVVRATLQGDSIVIDFRASQTYLLYLDATKPVIVVPPSIPVGRAGAWTLEIEQGPGAPFYVSAWAGCVFYPMADASVAPGAAHFSTTAGKVDVVAFRYAGFDATLRGMFRAGCST